jgi:RND family efflux transporter MFP subunit
MKKYLFLFLSCGILACHSAEEQKAKPEKEKPKLQMETARVETRPLSSTVNLPGELKAWETVQIFPKVNGFVKDVLVDRGSVVKKGQVLLRLEAPEMEQQYLAAKSKYLQEYTMFVTDKDRYTRMLATAKTPGTVAAYDIESARAKMLADSSIMEGEQANCRAIEAIKGYLTVTAPFDGVISERNVHPGALVGPGSRNDDKPMLLLEQESKLRLVVNIPEAYSNQIRPDASITFRVNALPGKTFQGKVSRSAGSLNMKYRSETIEIDQDNRQRLLKPGMFAEVILPVRRTGESLSVPATAIVTSTERKYVILVEEGKTKWVDIQQGNTEGDVVEIFGAVKAGNNVLKNATDEIKEGISVGN